MINIHQACISYDWRSRSCFKTIQNVIVIVWEAALPPCICALLTLITYFTLADFSSWDLLFQALLGQLYVISLFVTLCANFLSLHCASLGLS